MVAIKEKTSRTGSVEKALRLIDCFSMSTRELTLDDLSKQTGFSKSTVFRMISSLEKFRYIKASNTVAGTLYSLGMAFLEKGNLVSSQLDVREISKRFMIDLRNHTNLTVQLAIRDDNEAVYIEQVESFREFKIFPGVGKRIPLYAAACPRILLAFLPDHEQDELLDSFHFVAFTPNSKIDPIQLKKDLQTIQDRGYEVSEGEIYEGTVAIAAPIRNQSGETIASLSVTGLKNDFSNDLFESTVQDVIRSANQISEQLGYRT